MTIRFDQDIDDVMVFQRYYFRNDPQNRKTMRRVKYFYSLIFVFMGILMSFTDRPLKDIVIIWIAVGIAILVWLLCCERWLEKLTLKRFRKMFLRQNNRIFFGERVMTFDNEGFTLKTADVDDSVKWSAVTGIARDGSNILIFISSVSAFVIPLHKLPKEDADTLVQMLDSFTEKTGK